MIGIQAPKVIEPDYDLHNFEKINLNAFPIEIIKTPGHSPGGTCLILRNVKKIITGDTIFFESIGRTDLWGGDFEVLIQSIKKHILSLPDDLKFYQDTVDSTTIKHEKFKNPFLN